MHELGLAQSICGIVTEHADGRAVGVVRVALGPLACVERSALHFCWGLVTENTLLQGAELAFVAAEGDTFVVREFEYRESV